MDYKLEYVTDFPDLWGSSDPVRPELGVEFKSSVGRGVFGLKGGDGLWKAFLCYARTFLVPKDVEELREFTREDGNIIIPYTVWSNEKGAGRAIINKIIDLIKCDPGMCVDRVVTLSPKTKMAEEFHTRNKATRFRMNLKTVNFEYAIDR